MAARSLHGFVPRGEAVAALWAIAQFATPQRAQVHNGGATPSPAVSDLVVPRQVRLGVDLFSAFAGRPRDHAELGAPPRYAALDVAAPA